jgi:hypothetical protein
VSIQAEPPADRSPHLLPEGAGLIGDAPPGRWRAARVGLGVLLAGLLALLLLVGGSFLRWIFAPDLGWFLTRILTAGSLMIALVTFPAGMWVASGACVTPGPRRWTLLFLVLLAVQVSLVFISVAAAEENEQAAGERLRLMDEWDRRARAGEVPPELPKPVSPWSRQEIEALRLAAGALCLAEVCCFLLFLRGVASAAGSRRLTSWVTFSLVVCALLGLAALVFLVGAGEALWQLFHAHRRTPWVLVGVGWGVGAWLLALVYGARRAAGRMAAG